MGPPEIRPKKVGTPKKRHFRQDPDILVPKSGPKKISKKKRVL